MTSLRISHVCQSYVPMISGAALVVRNLAEGAARRGHQVQVLSASDRGKAYTDCSLEGLQVERVQSFPNPFRRSQRFSVWSARRLARLVDFRPDVIHIHDPTIMAKVKFLSSAPKVVTIHAYPDLVTSYVPDILWLRKGVESVLIRTVRRLLEPCDAIVTPSRAAAEYVSHYTDQEPHVISNGVDLNWFSPTQKERGEDQHLREKYGLRPDLPVILHVGRLDVEKNVETLVEVAARVLHGVNAQFLVVGDGLKRTAMIRLCQSLGIMNRSVFTGYVPPSGDLPGLYRLASVFISASEKETQGLVFLEAAACGLPIVSVRATAMQEIVEEGINGYLADIRDVETIAAHTKRIVENPALGRKLGRSGRAFMQRDHAMETTLLKYEQLYTEVIQRRHERQP